MKLNVYGKPLEIKRDNGRWKTFYLGNEGKKRIATDIHIPNEIKEQALIEYISDLCHEWATPTKNEIKIIK